MSDTGGASKASPNSKRNLVIGIVVGLGVTVGVAVGLWLIFDTKSNGGPLTPAVAETIATPPNQPTGQLVATSQPVGTGLTTMSTAPVVTTMSTPTTPATPPPPGIPGVRYIRVQRVRPSLQNENAINLQEIQVYYMGTQIPLVAGTVHNQNAPQYGWENLKDGVTGYANHTETKDEPGSYISVDLGAAKTVDEVIVWNRARGVGWNRIIGCELQLLNEAQAIIQKWDFASVANIPTNNTVQTTGAESYLVSATNMTMVARGGPATVTEVVSTTMATIPVVAGVPGIEGVRYIRVQRVRPSPTQNGNQINLSGIQVFSNGTQIPLVAGTVHEPLGGNYGWDKLKNGWRDGGMAHTTALADASITVDLGAAKSIDQITVYNRAGGLGWFLIIGCELQVLNEAQGIIQRWDFPATPTAGAASYTVGKATQMNLVVGTPS